MAAGVLLVLVLGVSLFFFSLELRIVAALVAVTWIVLKIAQIAYMSRIRLRFT
jgi:hypothetical protein